MASNMRKTGDPAQKRRQINLVFTRTSRSLRTLEEAERITGQSPTKIVRSLIDSRLAGWLQEEIEKRRQLEAAAQRAHTTDGALSVRQLGKQRPRYRGES